MTTANETTSIDTRLSALEIRMASVEALLNNLAGASPRKTKKISVEEKDRMKSELLKGVPYDNKKLEKLNSIELKILASALGINSFGMKRVDIVKGVLSKQKK
jgi:uncharacterized coiled-coil protein SlyX